MAAGTERDAGQGAEEELRGNSLLAALPDAEFERLLPHVAVADVGLRDVVVRRREPIAEVHFPLSSVYSMVALGADEGVAVEVATIGHEGMVGLPLFLGAATSPNQVFCQIAGRSATVSAGDLGEFLAGDGALHGLLHRYAQVTLVQVSQNVLCNSSHPTEQRAARWLLTTADRVRDHTFALTQDFLAQMLGVRRQTVSEVAGRLQDAGLIRYTRGVVTVLDRSALQDATCECYALIKAEFDRTGD